MLSCFGFDNKRGKHNARNLLEVTTNVTVDADVAAAGEVLVLMEIVSAMGIESEWGYRVNPYCIVRMHHEAIHETKPMYNDPNPIWTVKTGAFCLLKIPEESGVDISAPNEQETSSPQPQPTKESVKNGFVEDEPLRAIIVEVCHGNHCVGVVTVPFQAVFEAQGQRKEYPIRDKIETKPEKSNDSVGDVDDKGILAVRFRRATQDDLTFLLSLHQQHHQSLLFDKNGTDQSVVTAADVHFRNVVQNSLFRQNRKVGKDHTVRHRVRPFPDPARPDQTAWLTEDELQTEAMKPSKKWIEAGSGVMGTIFLEILGCDNLPNLDVGLNNQTDAFVGIAFEETMLRTHVIHDCLSPRWMPWCTRAFALSVRHPASLLMLAVFDYDEVSPFDNHDPVGRVVVNMTNFESKTVYLLHYKLHHDAREDDSRGTIIIRLRIQWEDEILAYKHSLTLPPPFYINVNSIKSLNVLRYITRGAVDLEEPSLDSVKMYADELLSYRHNLFYFLDVMLNIFLWRGRANVAFFGSGRTWNVWFPIHSVILFTCAVLAVEFPSKFPAILLYLIAWSLLTINYHGSRDPYPWHRCKAFYQTSVVLFLLGRSNQGHVRIEPNVGAEEAKALSAVDKLKAARVEVFLLELVRVSLKLYGVYSKNTKRVDLATKEVRLSIFTSTPFSTLHLILQLLCVNIRMYRNLINWSSYYANRFTVNCLILGTIWLIFPIETIALWLIRIFAWTFLGPWMKLVDIFWAHKHYRTYEELRAQPELIGSPNFDYILDSEMVRKMGRVGRLYAEEARKLKDMREHLYGHYSKRVPSFDQSRYPSTPLPQSTAQPYRLAEEVTDDGTAVAQNDTFVDIPASEQEWQYVPDQKLVGNMIHVEASKSFRTIQLKGVSS